MYSNNPQIYVDTIVCSVLCFPVSRKRTSSRPQKWPVPRLRASFTRRETYSLPQITRQIVRPSLLVSITSALFKRVLILLITRDIKSSHFHTHAYSFAASHVDSTLKQNVPGVYTPERIEPLKCYWRYPSQRACQSLAHDPLRTRAACTRVQYPGTISAVRFRGIVLAVLAAALAAPLVAQTPAPQSADAATSKLVSVEVTGTKRYPTDKITVESGLTIGQLVARSDLQTAADKLADLGVFSQVNYRFKTIPGGVALEFVVEDAPTVPVEYDNIPWFTDDEITAAIKKAVGLFDGAAPESGTILDQMTAAIEALLPSRGIHAVVDRDVTEDPLSDGKMIEFHIEGDTLPVSSVHFGDPAAAADPHVRQSLADIIGKPYSRMTMELFEIEQVRPVYLASGHLRVQFGAPQVRFQGDPNGPVPSKVVVTLPIVPDAIYHWSAAQWTGNTVLDAATLNGLIGLKPGDLADGMAISDGWTKIEQAYQQQGHLDAKVTPQQTIDDANARVSYNVSIDEGPLYRMGDLVITGLSVDGENRVRAAFHLSPAQIFDQVYVDDFIAKLQKPTPEIFGDLPIHYTECGHWVRPNTATHLADVLLDFR